MSWKVHETDEVFAALRGLCSNSYRMYDPSEYRCYYDHDCETYECAVEEAAEEYERLVEHCTHQREQLAKRSRSKTIGILMELLNEYRESECALDEDRVSWYAARLDGRTEDERMDERMSITDELRRIAAKTECASGRCEKLYRGDLDHIADRIDAEYAAYRAAVYAIPKEYVKLPVDADGVPIKLGDIVNEFEVRRLVLIDKDTWDVEDRFGEPFNPSTLHHTVPDSWERIIEDALTVGWPNGNWAEVASAEIHERLVERCRRLAGEGA